LTVSNKEIKLGCKTIIKTLDKIKKYC
jgi:hypothetical protein